MPRVTKSFHFIFLMIFPIIINLVRMNIQLAAHLPLRPFLPALVVVVVHPAAITNDIAIRILKKIRWTTFQCGHQAFSVKKRILPI